MKSNISSPKQKRAPIVISQIRLYLNGELKTLIGHAADEEDKTLTEFIVGVLAKFVKRPDLAKIRGRRPGRPWKDVPSQEGCQLANQGEIDK